jgi:hypothetical protein
MSAPVTEDVSNPVRTVRIGIVGGFLGLLAFLSLSSIPLCPFASLTGLPCPGCGFMRATVALLGGDVTSAIRFQPLVLVTLPLLGVWAFRLIRNQPNEGRSSRWLMRASVALLIAFFGLWLARFAGAFGGPVSVRAFWQAFK